LFFPHNAWRQAQFDAVYGGGIHMQIFLKDITVDPYFCIRFLKFKQTNNGRKN
jgi:hypothetical protein